MTTLHAIATDVATTAAAAAPNGWAVVVGPPFVHPPAAPCVVVELPRVREVVGVDVGCRLTGATIDVVVIPPTATDADALLIVADRLVAAFGAAVVSGQTEPHPYTDTDAHVYRLTLEE